MGFWWRTDLAPLKFAARFITKSIHGRTVHLIGVVYNMAPRSISEHLFTPSRQPTREHNNLSLGTKGGIILSQITLPLLTWACTRYTTELRPGVLITRLFHLEESKTELSYRNVTRERSPWGRWWQFIRCKWDALFTRQMWCRPMFQTKECL